ncbi:serine/threonine protein kinase, partial [bacterium]|nr:serine/threonine protein kinase [bacterium]
LDGAAAVDGDASGAPDRRPGGADRERPVTQPAVVRAGRGRELGRVGPYRLVRQIGEGGMGLVYEAEQLHPIRRKVALKMVKRGLDTAEFISRFESERQALAMMDHPCIARVFDAGATDQGRPYFVMEYVEGIPLHEYCNLHRLTVRQRLELFGHVCDGVQHAHQKAIIHRDLKPSNVLVTVIDGQPVPKIIDFGVAKATDSSVFESTLTTSVGQLVGTPEYMSPEQADLDGGGIDTRTDVYALGVMLYELLVGRLPFTSEEFKEMGFKKALQTIREVEPPRPSTRLGTIADMPDQATIVELAERRRTSPSHLQRDLRGDLDWITMKAIEKERDRRYETANALALDIGRHLAFQPVLAGPPSTAYRMRKFVRRNRTGVAAGAVVGVAVVLGIFGTTAGLIRAVRAEKQARVEAETARQVSDFLVDLFEVADPDQARGNTITAREILDNGARRIDEELGEQPLTQARLMGTIGKVYRKLGLFEEAEPQLERALALKRAQPDVAGRELAVSLAELADLYISLARYDEAETMLLQALDLMQGTDLENGLEVAQSLNELASVYRRQGQYDKARPLYERALDLRVARLGPVDPEVASSYNSLGILAFFDGRYAAAEQYYKRAGEIWEQAYGENHGDVAKALNNLALLYHHLDRYDEAEPVYERANAIYAKVLGKEHPRYARGLNNLGLVRCEAGRYEGVEALYTEALRIREKVFGDEHPEVAQTLANLAFLDAKLGHFVAADSLALRAMTIRMAVFGRDHPDVAWSWRNLGLVRLEEERYAEAAEDLRTCLDMLSRALAPDHPDLADPYVEYAQALQALGRTAEADSLRTLGESLRPAAAAPR